MRKLNSLTFGLILGITVFTGCRDLADDVSVNPDQHLTNETYQLTPVVLGERYEPSWGVESMRTFYNAMAESFPNARMLSAEEAIQTSHYYMRFLPQNTQEYDTLRALGIDLNPFPLDYALEQNGDVFLDPENESDSIIWQYSIVKKEIVFPSYIQHEILQETYMPLLVEEEGLANGRIAKVLLDDEVSTGEFLEMCAILDNNLLDSALIALNLFDSLYYDAALEDTVNSGGRIAGKKWKFRLKSPVKALAQVVKTVKNTVNAINILKWGPSGHIRVQYVHPRTGVTVTEGVANVEVVAWQGLLKRAAFTKADGSYSMEFPVLAPVLFSLSFQNNYVTVRYPTGIITANKPGPVKALNKGWSYTATTGDPWAHSWAAVMNAANDYYKILPDLNNEYETDAPPRGLKIRVRSNRNDGGNPGYNHMLNATLADMPLNYATIWLTDKIVNDIWITGIQDPAIEYHNVYATAIHELGHAAHWGLVGSNSYTSGIRMLNTESRVRETWADAVEQFAFRRKFSPTVAENANPATVNLGPWVPGRQQCGRTLNFYQGTDYVSILGPDLWDNFNQSCNSINDNVSGIPLIQTYRTLKDARTWNQWRDALIARYPAQAADITAYFAQF